MECQNALELVLLGICGQINPVSNGGKGIQLLLLMIMLKKTHGLSFCRRNQKFLVHFKASRHMLRIVELWNAGQLESVDGLVCV